MLVGYARVSTTHQNLDSQITALKEAGCTKIFTEKRSGTTLKNRDELNNALEFVRDGDIFIVNRLDRFARSIQDMNDTIKSLQNKGVGFRALEQNINISADGSDDSMSKLMLNILGSFAEFETDIRKERQLEGIANALKKGVKFGVKQKVSNEDIKDIVKLRSDGVSIKEIMSKYNISKATIYKYIKEYNKT